MQRGSECPETREVSRDANVRRLQMPKLLDGSERSTIFCGELFSRFEVATLLPIAARKPMAMRSTVTSKNLSCPPAFNIVERLLF